MERGMFDENFRLGNILNEANIGLWYIELEEGSAPRMYGDCAMLELLGIEGLPTPEECYRHWYERIEHSYLGMVDEVIQVMAARQHGEVSYAWEHPKWGTIYIRCGGNCDPSYTKGLRLKGYHQNISELVSLKQEAEQLKSFQQKMLESLKELYFSVLLLEIDRDIIYPLYASQEGNKSFGVKASTAYMMEQMVKFYHPEDQDQMQEDISLVNLERCLDQGVEKLIREFRRKIQGKYRWVSITCYFMHQSSCNRKVLIAIQDIDEQKRHEKEYQEYLKNSYMGNMELLRMSLKNSNIFEFFYYPTEERLVIPEMTAQYFDYPTELQGINHENAAKIVDKSYQNLFYRVHSYIKDGGKNDYFYYSCKQGKFWCKCSISSVIFNEDGHTEFAVGMIEDLTRQRIIEWENEQYQSIYRNTVELEYDGICIMDLKTGEVIAKLAESVSADNKAKRENLSFIKKRFIEELMCPEDQERFREEFDILSILSQLEREEVVHFYFVSEKNNEKRHKDCAIRYFNEDRTKLFVCIRDIEQQLQTERESKEALQKAFEAAKHANEAKSEFISKMSHDIRTPMNAIVGMTAIAKANIDDKERVLDCLDKVKVANEHLLSLVNEVLDMSRIESGKMSLSQGEFDLGELLEDVICILKPRAQQKEQELTLELRSLHHTAVIGDELSLQKIFNNLIGNAVKYTQEGGQIHVLAEELPSPHLDYGHYRFIFEDNGYGMSKEYLDKLFVPFERASDSKIEQIEGTGLGMPIVYNLIQLMQGEIQVESELEQGSKFTITLFFPLQSQENIQEESQEPQKKIFFEGKRVLLAEDNELNVEIAQEILKNYGLEISVAYNGQEAVQIYQEKEAGYFDMIFMDIQMPVMDGYTAAGKIRGCDKVDSLQIPIAAMTANAFSEDVQKAMHAGMNDHVAKPIELDKLEKVLTKWLD